jgi:hypothetical protein
MCLAPPAHSDATVVSSPAGWGSLDLPLGEGLIREQCCGRSALLSGISARMGQGWQRPDETA